MPGRQARGVSFAVAERINVPMPAVADDAWGGAIDEHPAPPPPPQPPCTHAPPARPIATPAPPPATSRPDRGFPTLRGLCLTVLAQHSFWLAEVAAGGGEGSRDDNDNALRRALPSPDDRLVLSAAAKRRGCLDAPLFMALADPAWPVLSIDSSAVGLSQPPARAVVAAARAGLLRGVRAVDWALPGEGAEAAALAAAATAPATAKMEARAGGKRVGAKSGAAAAAPAHPPASRVTPPPPPPSQGVGGVGPPPSSPPLPTLHPVLLPSEAAAVVHALAAHCPALESLTLQRADPARRARPAVVTALSRALLAAALPRDVCGKPLLVGQGDDRSFGGREAAAAVKKAAAAVAAGAAAAAAAAAGVVDSWEEALSDDREEGAEAGLAGDARPATSAAEREHEATFASSLCSLRWQDMPDATAGGIAARCPRIAVDRRQPGIEAALDAPWMAALAPGWDDRGAERAERRAEERRQREAARRTALFVAGPLAPSDQDEEQDEEGKGGRRPPDDGRAVAAAAEAASPAEQAEPLHAGESLAERFRRAYEERAARLRRVDAAKDEQRRRRAVRASPGLALVERWLDEAV